MSAGRRSKRSSARPFPVVNEHAAGIDIGSRFHVAAVSPDSDDEPVRTFGTFTGDLHRLADWLASAGVTTVAMESTSVYWIPLFEILESRGFTVILANAREAKNVPGRKTDVNDAQWLQRLHCFGLLRASFRPHERMLALRAYLRQRERHVEYAASHVQHMQKALGLKLDRHRPRAITWKTLTWRREHSAANRCRMTAIDCSRQQSVQAQVQGELASATTPARSATSNGRSSPCQGGRQAPHPHPPPISPAQPRFPHRLTATGPARCRICSHQPLKCRAPSPLIPPPSPPACAPWLTRGCLSATPDPPPAAARELPLSLRRRAAHTYAPRR